MPIIKAEKLHEIGVSIFRGVGATDYEANQVMKLLVESNLVGHDSHGVIRIPSYIDQIMKGNTKLGQSIEIIKESPTTALINGKWGLGQVIATQTMNLAIEKAEENNIGVVSTFNCKHIGRMADYVLMAAENDMIGYCCVNSRPGVVPFGGIERMFNQSPLGWAIPGKKEPPYVLDISTSVCAGGKISVARARGEQLPPGYIIDKMGNPSTDPKDFFEGGAALPLGGPVGYKGFGLAMVIDIMAGILSGRGASYLGGERGQGIFQMAIRIDAFRPVEEFKKEIDDLIGALQNSTVAPGFKEILIPGEPERRTKIERQKKGIYISQKTWEELEKTGQKVNVDIEQIIS
jgi:uncharacterized oxidoreductase